MKQEIKDKLLSINREGMKELVEHMEQRGFFESPGSTRFHGAYEGGLLDHCISVEKLFRDMIQKFNLEVEEETIIICSYLHDLCKVGAYIKNENSISWNRNHPSGHAKLSIERIEKFIKLTEQEKSIILYHMGMYGTTEFGGPRGEYSIQEIVGCYNNNKLAKLFYFCDDMSAQFCEK